MLKAVGHLCVKKVQLKEVYFRGTFFCALNLLMCGENAEN